MKLYNNTFKYFRNYFFIYSLFFFFFIDTQYCYCIPRWAVLILEPIAIQIHCVRQGAAEHDFVSNVLCTWFKSWSLSTAAWLYKRIILLVEIIFPPIVTIISLFSITRVCMKHMHTARACRNTRVKNKSSSIKVVSHDAKNKHPVRTSSH